MSQVSKAPGGFCFLLPTAHLSPPGSLPGTDGVFPRAQLEQSKALELQGVMAAEAGDLSTALERFGQAINLLPEKASAYSNRAQARLLQGDVAGEGRVPGACAEGPGRAQTRDGVSVGLGHGAWEVTKPLWNLCLYP